LLIVVEEAPATPVGEVCRPIYRSSASGLKESIKF